MSEGRLWDHWIDWWFYGFFIVGNFFVLLGYG